jgi:hypothetical protein
LGASLPIEMPSKRLRLRLRLLAPMGGETGGALVELAEVLRDDHPDHPNQEGAIGLVRASSQPPGTRQPACSSPIARPIHPKTPTRLYRATIAAITTPAMAAIAPMEWGTRQLFAKSCVACASNDDHGARR